VRIDAACLDCGDPLTVEMLDGRLTWVDPPTVVGHLNESEEGFISLPALVGFFGAVSRQHMLDADYLSRWFPMRAAERREYLARIGKSSPFWLGTPAPSA